MRPRSRDEVNWTILHDSSHNLLVFVGYPIQMLRRKQNFFKFKASKAVAEFD
jgi:hypothetical protein